MGNDYNPFLPENTKIQSEEEKREQWLKERAGNFTGSSISDLASCGRKNFLWTDPLKVYDVGASFFSYTYKVMMERLTGIYDHEMNLFQFEYGHENEPLFIEKLIEDDVIQSHSECDFMLYKDTNLGATPDGRITKDGLVMSLEMKSCMSWSGVYKRKKDVVDDKHCDFWQIQTEMLVMGTTKCLFAVAHPMSHTSYDVEVVDRSEIHQNFLLKRYELAEKCIAEYEEGSWIDSCKRTIENERQKCLDTITNANAEK